MLVKYLEIIAQWTSNETKYILSATIDWIFFVIENGFNGIFLIIDDGQKIKNILWLCLT